jgi:deoxyribodipyrimidine photo-lyase
MKIAFWWIRRDLRLEDNPALEQALAFARLVIPVFILDKHLLYGSRSSDKRSMFLFDGLQRMNQELGRFGGRLILRQGAPGEELGRLLSETQATKIFAEPDYSPYARKRDAMVSEQYPITWVGSPAIHPPGSILKKDGKPYTIFTPFSRASRGTSLPGFLKSQNKPQFESLPFPLESLPINDLPVSRNGLFPAGEVEARHRLRRFTETIEEEMNLDQPILRYGANRNRLDLDDTSRLSPYLRFGMLSAREAAATVQEILQSRLDHNEILSAESWLNELIWRDFYIHVLYHFPEVLKNNFRSLRVHWKNDPYQFKAWCAGETGYPVVDAAMRQLMQTGWMHNRARMVVASFLTKDLLINWNWGEKWFMQHLIDGDVAANNGGWQWAAGTGTDAAPYFRIINPIIQGQKYDPQGVFIRAWLPELAEVPIGYLHTPWTMPLSVQLQAGCQIGKDYPAPIVDHGWARQRALQAYRRSSK